MSGTEKKAVKIPAMFAKVPSKPATKCPVCNVAASLKEIDRHLEEGCPATKTDIVEAAVCKNDVVTVVDDDDDVFDDSDTEYEKLAASAEVDRSPTIRASKSLSQSPKKFGGIASLVSLGQVEFKNPSPKRPRFSSPFRHLAAKNGKSGGSSEKISPEKASVSPSSTLLPKKKLFDSNEENLAHVPLTQSKRKDPSHIPYYLVNFETVVRGVIDETDDVQLFDPDDLQIVETFRSLDLDSRKLYVRLFQRKFGWIQNSNISYDEIFDKKSATEHLVENKFLLDSTKLDDLPTVLNLLSAPNVKKLCKDLNIQAKGTQKQDGIDALISHSKKKSFFAVKSNSIADIMFKKASSMLDSCFCLTEEPRKIFHRIFSLYSLSNWWDERENDKGQPVQLTTILLQNTGRIVFPCYDVIRSAKIFRDKSDLLLFEKSINLESRIADVVETKNFEAGVPICEEAKTFFRQILDDQDLCGHVLSLPSFLRKFTSGSVVAYVLTKCVEIFERLKRHQDAVDLLKSLLAQDLYLPDYHGLWYERLTLDLDGHLKQPERALEAIEAGLNDEHVRVARKLTLCQRVIKICNTKKNSKLCEKFLQMFQSTKNWICPEEPPTKIIQGRLMPKENLPGAKTVFVHESVVCNDGVYQKESLLCSVEEFVREHYKSELNFSHGLHGEGAVVNTVTGILFWDVIYDIPVPDAFRGPHQAYPLDLNSDDFYSNRRESIDQRLQEIETWSSCQLAEFATDRFTKSLGISASLCNWDLFRDADHLCGLLKCLDGHQWKAICERLIKNHRHTRSGFPDLTLWNPDTGKCCFVEVKSPNDRLSTKQILWIEYLNKHEIESLVCHVEALNARKIVTSSSASSRPNSSNDVLTNCNSEVAVHQHGSKSKASPKKPANKKLSRVALMSGESIDADGCVPSKKSKTSGSKTKRSRKSSGDDFELT